jgi:hypothetical protein
LVHDVSSAGGGASVFVDPSTSGSPKPGPRRSGLERSIRLSAPTNEVDRRSAFNLATRLLRWTAEYEHQAERLFGSEHRQRCRANWKKRLPFADTEWRVPGVASVPNWSGTRHWHRPRPHSSSQRPERGESMNHGKRESDWFCTQCLLGRIFLASRLEFLSTQNMMSLCKRSRFWKLYRNRRSQCRAHGDSR